MEKEICRYGNNRSEKKEGVRRRKSCSKKKLVADLSLDKHYTIKKMLKPAAKRKEM